VILKDVLREYEGQEAHTVHLVFTPKSSKHQSKQSLRQTAATSNSNPNLTQNAAMSTSELRQRNVVTATPATSSGQQQPQQQYQPNAMNIPNSYLNAFYAGSSNTPGQQNDLLSQHYMQYMQHMQQQATQYMSHYMSLVQSPEAFYQMSQQHSQNPQNFAFVQPQMPLSSSTPSDSTSEAAAQQLRNNNEVQGAQPLQQPAQPAAEAPQRRFPNIIQDEQENRDWLDILYSMSRLMILLCLIYFYSSPVRCLVVILIGITIYL